MITPSPFGLLDRAGVESRIPHCGRMCLLDRLDAWDDDKIVCAASNHRAPDHPLRTRSGLLVGCAIEYAAQAMALHGALTGEAAGRAPAPGYLASARGVRFGVLRLDDLPSSPTSDAPDELTIEAIREAGDGRQILYSFTVRHGARVLADGRAAVVLDTPPAG